MVFVEVRAVADTEIFGVWCPTCLLPSAVSIPFHLRTGVASSLGSFVITACPGCCTWITEGESADPVQFGIDRSPCEYGLFVAVDEEDQAGDDHAHA